MKPPGPTRTRDRSRAGRHRVVIVGCGFGGLFAAKALARTDVEVTVIDRSNHHLFQPLLYQVATGILSEGDIAPPIREVLRRQRNADVILGEVRAVDVERRNVAVDTLGLRSQVGYDSLIVAAGAQQSYFGHPEFAADAPGMKDDRPRARAARTDLRRFRDGRSRARPGRAARVADLRGRWRRPDRSRAGRTDRGARPRPFAR